MSSIIESAEQRVVMHGVSWKTYLALAYESNDRHARIAYDQGELEIMSPSRAHERLSSFVGRMVETLTEELQIDIDSVASTTFQREDQQRGFEADESYYIAHVAEVRDCDEIDLAVQPPPDLVIEVDISHSSRSKLMIFEKFGVPEVWRLEGDHLLVFVLGPNEKYLESTRSVVLPQFPVADMPRWLARRNEVGETQCIRDFRQSISSPHEQD